MNKFAGIAAFVAGAAVGAAASWYFTKNKYEQIAQDEIDSVKEAFLGAPCEEEEQEDGSPSEDEEDSSDKVHTPVVAEKPSIEEYVAMVEDRGYTKYSDTEKKEVKPMEVNKKPYVIPPEEFGEIINLSGICIFFQQNNHDKSLLGIIKGFAGVSLRSLYSMGLYSENQMQQSSLSFLSAKKIKFK